MIDLLFYWFTKINRRFIKSKNRLKYKFFLKKLGNGSYIRNGIQISGNPKKISIGTKFQIYDNCFFGVSEDGQINIGNNGLLGVGCYLNATEGIIEIGNNVAIGPYCKLFSFSHHYNPGGIYIKSSKTGNIVIEENVFIGANVVILPGVRICRNSVIAAGAVVNRDVEADTIVGGVPARQIKNLNEDINII